MHVNVFFGSIICSPKACILAETYGIIILSVYCMYLRKSISAVVPSFQTINSARN